MFVFRKIQLALFPCNTRHLDQLIRFWSSVLSMNLNKHEFCGFDVLNIVCEDQLKFNEEVTKYGGLGRCHSVSFHL